jgi:hypothetical protein
MLEVRAMLRKVKIVGLLVLLLAPGLTAAARADHPSMALGTGGELYTVTAGLYGSLFPGSKTYDAATPVLALDTVVPGSAPKRQLVPSTEDQYVESSPALIYENGSKTLFVVWLSSSQGLVSGIRLASYGDGKWSPPITIICNSYALKTPPQLAVTRDTHQELDPASGNPVTHSRTVLHLVWSENSASGLYQAYYAPVILEDGAWIGTVPIPVHLNQFDAAEQTAQAAGTAPFVTPLAYTPTIQGGRDLSTAVGGFASETSGMLTAVEVDVLPEELRILADACAAAIRNQGAQYFPTQLGSIADLAQAAILANGSSFQPEALQAIIAPVRQQILSGDIDLDHMVVKSRGHVIEIGSKFSRRGLRLVASGPGPVVPSQILEIVPDGGLSQFIQFRIASTHPAPAVGANGLQLFLSRSGDDALAAWTSADNKSVLYTSTQPDGTWSGVLQLQLSASLDLQHAYQVLQQRIVN